MKKTFAVIMALALSSAMLSGCGGENNTKKTDTKKDTSSAQQFQEEEQAEYVVNIDDSFDSGLELGDKRDTLSPEEADFRNLKWDMTKEEVIYAQGTGYREPDENTLYYTRVREEEYPADAEYTFEDDKLVLGVFYITHNKEDKLIEIKDYNELVTSLSDRFGTPEMSEQKFTDDADKTDDEQKQVELIKSGKLQFRTRWTLDGTELRVVLFQRNGEMCIGLQYKKA